MRFIRRHDHAARVELLPLIDVIFLLLTFFIYSLILMHRVEVLPVQLMPVEGGATLKQSQTHALTIDGAGRIHFDRREVTLDELRQRLAEFAAQPKPGSLLVAVEENASADRLPVFFEVWQMIREAGIEHFSVVGRPGEEDAPPRDAGATPNE